MKKNKVTLKKRRWWVVAIAILGPLSLVALVVSMLFDKV